MTRDEEEKLKAKIRELNADQGRLFKTAGGQWHIEVHPPEVAAPIINLPTRQWGTKPAVVVEGNR